MAMVRQALSSSAAASALSALSAGSPETLVIGGVVLGVTALGVLTYEAYEAHQLAEFQKEVKTIQDIYSTHLAKIKVNGVDKSLPPVFNVDNVDKPTKIEALHLTKAQMLDIMDFSSDDPRIELNEYKGNVQNAIRELIKYYNARSNGKEEKLKDVTSGVLSYLLQMLNNHCVNFAGYDLDIAYLTKIADFINAYASSEGKESSHYSHLKEPYAYLLNAKKCLEEHQKKLSLTDSFTELTSIARDNAAQLLRYMTQAVIPNAKWNFIDTMTLENLCDGIVSKKYIASQTWGLVWRTDSVIPLPNSIFKDWILLLTKYHLQVTNLAQGVVSAIPQQAFVLPDLKQLNELRSKRGKGKAEKERKQILEAQMTGLKNVMQNTQSFLSQKLNNKKEYTAIVDEAELLQRLEIFVKIATATKQLISLQQIGNQLIKSATQLGDISLQNPHHYRSVFIVLHELSLLTKASINALLTDIAEVDDANQNVMELNTIKQFENNVITCLKETVKGLQKYDDLISTLRTEAENNPENAKAEARKAKRVMFELAENLAKLYGINNLIEKEAPHQAPVAEHKSEVVATLHLSPTIVHAHIESTTNSESTSNHLPPPVHTMEEKLDTDIHTITNGTPPNITIAEAKPIEIIKSPNNIPGTLADIRVKIDSLKATLNTEDSYKELNFYEEAYKQLILIHSHYVEMNLSPTLNLKARAALGLQATAELCKIINEYLASERTPEEAHNLAEKIEIEANVAEKHFANQHTNKLTFWKSPASKTQLEKFLGVCRDISKLKPQASITLNH